VRNARDAYINHRALAASALGLLVAILAGCGGGGGSQDPSETAIRKKLEAGAQKVKKATSARVSLGFELEDEGEQQQLGCVDLASETGKPERFELIFFNVGCEGGTEAHTLIAIGGDAWSQNSPEEETWTPAKITKRLREELADEQTDVDQLFVQAENITEHPEGAGIESDKTGKFTDVPSYTFEAPASAFPAAGEDVGDVTVEFEAVLDQRGVLHELVIHTGEGETSATVTATYEDVGKDLGVKPPDPSEVHGPVQRIDSKADLDQLFGVPSS
jgi:hypothetical protein